MDAPTRMLFGRFPRSVGVSVDGKTGLTQYLVHSDDEFDGVVDEVRGRRNLYSSISAFQPAKVDGEYAGNAVVVDKVSFDLDSTAKAASQASRRWAHPLLDDNAPDREVAEQMQEDPHVLEGVLGDVCEDARALATASMEAGIPVVGVFSGFGIHIHQLYEPTMSRPADKLASNARRWQSELGLTSVDDRASGKPYRIMRIPNVRRVCHDDDNRPLDLVQVPLTGDELAEITPEKLLDLSRRPRPSLAVEPDSRPELSVKEDYLGPQDAGDVEPEQMRDAPMETPGSEFAQDLVERLTQMPCVYERAVGSNPPNDVRYQLGTLLLASGLAVDEALEVIAGLNWTDFDRSVTEYQLEKIRENNKGAWSCATMQSRGLCTRADCPEDCEAYGYAGGETPRETGGKQ